MVLCIKNCSTHAYYGLIGEKPMYCKKHKLENMIDVVNKRCLNEKCNKQPKFGLSGEKPEYCKKHKLENMVDVINKRCLNENCNKQPKFGLSGEKPEYCKKHKLENMVDVINKRCLNENCDTRPSHGLQGEKPEYCSLHKLEQMVDVVSKKCTSCGIFTVNKKRNYLCSYCSPTHRQTTKEDIVKALLQKNSYTFIHDKQIANDSCIRNRPDFLFDCHTYYVILECDEDAHKSYEKECEFVRMNNISYVLNKPTLFIRYNPDLKQVKRKEKHETLLKTLDRCLYKECIPQNEPIYLFYF